MVEAGIDARGLAKQLGIRKRTGVKRAMLRWKKNLTAAYLAAYHRNTKGKKGLRNISTFGGTRSPQTSRGIQFQMFADAALARTSRRKSTADKWNAITYQAEFGTTRDGSKTIYPKNANVLAIPVAEKAKNKSPKSFTGKWVRTKAQKLIFVETPASHGGVKVGRKKYTPKLTRTHRPISEPRGARAGAKSPMGQVVLYVGAPTVQVRQQFQGFFRHAVLSILGAPEESLFFPGPGGAFAGLDPNLAFSHNSFAAQRLRIQLQKELGGELSDYEWEKT